MKKPLTATSEISPERAAKIREEINNGDYKCIACGKLFFKGKMEKGEITPKCPRCKEYTTFLAI